MPPPPESRKTGRNADWPHLFNRDVISMPDKWEYPWYAAWDLAFHMIPLARLDPEFAKEQLVLLLREWYMHPNGQIPGLRMGFRRRESAGPRLGLLARLQDDRPRAASATGVSSPACSRSCCINFTWWVNRKDARGKHLSRAGSWGWTTSACSTARGRCPAAACWSRPTARPGWRFYCATMLAMALELARDDPASEDIASKFFEHFVYIADAINTIGGTGLWNEEDGFYYDQIYVDGRRIPLRIRSIVGLIPLLTVEVLSDELIGGLPGFQKRLDWFLAYRRDLASHISYMETQDGHVSRDRRLLAIPSRQRLERVLRYIWTRTSSYPPTASALCRNITRNTPTCFSCGGQEYRVEYAPGESNTNLFGGNSNWRGPVWFPLNYLLIEALERYHYFYGDTLKVECPTGSGRWMDLAEVAKELSSRLVKLFLPDQENSASLPRRHAGRRGEFGYADLLLFHEYFHGETGAGLGACHQTGWTSLVADCLWKLARGKRATGVSAVQTAPTT